MPYSTKACIPPKPLFHVHGVGVDSHGDIYAGLTVDKSVDKFVRVR